MILAVALFLKWAYPKKWGGYGICKPKTVEHCFLCRLFWLLFWPPRIYQTHLLAAKGTKKKKGRANLCWKMYHDALPWSSNRGKSFLADLLAQATALRRTVLAICGRREHHGKGAGVVLRSRRAYFWHRFNSVRPAARKRCGARWMSGGHPFF